MGSDIDRPVLCREQQSAESSKGERRPRTTGGNSVDTDERKINLAVRRRDRRIADQLQRGELKEGARASELLVGSARGIESRGRSERISRGRSIDCRTAVDLAESSFAVPCDRWIRLNHGAGINDREIGRRDGLRRTKLVGCWRRTRRRGRTRRGRRTWRGRWTWESVLAWATDLARAMDLAWAMDSA